MKLLEDIWAWLKEWNNWKAKDWIKAGVVALAVIFDPVSVVALVTHN